MKIAKKAFTLVELLVAAFLTLLLSAILFGLLRNLIGVWESTEEQSRLHEDARKIFSSLQQDLAAVCTQADARREIQLFVDRDEQRRQRLRFVKRLAPEKYSPVLSDAGNSPLESGADRYYYFDRRREKLRAPGGTAEVVYCMLPGKDELWCGARAPIGGSGSFFVDADFRSAGIEKNCRRLASRVLYFGIQCGSGRTVDWKSEDPVRGGASRVWDSTCRTMPDFFLYRRLDRAFPDKLRITLLLAGENSASGTLRSAVDSTQKSAELRNSRNFYSPAPGATKMFKIGEEWVSCSQCENGKLEGLARGILDSIAQPHPAGTPVFGAQLFSITISLPTSSE